MPLRYYLTLLSILLLYTCAPAPENETSAGEPAATRVATPAVPAGKVTSYPSISLERLEFLWNNATYLDATFYNLPVSINQDALPQIRSTLQTVGQEPAELPAGCQPAGRVWFQVEGKNKEEADIYFSEGCYGYVWMENGQPAYSNKMTQDGLQFYNNILQSVRDNTGVQ